MAWLAALLASALLLSFVGPPRRTPAVEVPYSEFRERLRTHHVRDVTVGATVEGTLMPPGPSPQAQTPVRFRARVPSAGDPDLLRDLASAGVTYRAATPPSPIGTLVATWVLPFVLLVAVWFWVIRRLGGRGTAGLFGVGRSTATSVSAADVGVTFADVGGADEAIEELQEIIQFLKTPHRFATLGGRIPKGVLLVGPPGTGKTLIAKATAGEAGVPFFETSGAEFEEMFVGVGAARVRDLFAMARHVAPAIVFIDEIDAIGQRRGGIARALGNDEREQTLNQLLCEIDGFKADADSPVIIMAATNRPEVLDPALLRAGRFDREVVLGNPDLVGRVQVLRIHSRHIRLAPDFDLDRAARVTPGFSGADLANVINEAALRSARRNASGVTFADFEAAIERVVGGLEQRSRVMNAREREVIAHHECGHGVVATLLPSADPVSKISIIPRSRGALGYTMQMPKEDRYLLSQQELEDQIAVMLAGRAAERLLLGTYSTGSSDDIERATELARRMVMEFGMSETLGAVRYTGERLRFLAGAEDEAAECSEATRHAIDTEVQRIIGAQAARATTLLSAHREPLTALIAALLEHETLDGNAVRAALLP